MLQQQVICWEPGQIVPNTRQWHTDFDLNLVEKLPVQEAHVNLALSL